MLFVAGQPDAGTWAALGALALFWVIDLVLMILHKKTVSKLTGEWEKGHLLRRIGVGAALIFLTLHLEFFP